MTDPAWLSAIPTWWRWAAFKLPTQDGATVERAGWVSGCGRYLVSVNPPSPKAGGLVPLFLHSRRCGHALAFWLTDTLDDVAPALVTIRAWIDAIDAHGLPLDVVLSGEGFDEFDPDLARVVAVLAHVTAARGGYLVADTNFQPAPGVH